MYFFSKLVLCLILCTSFVKSQKKTCVKRALLQHLGSCPERGSPCRDTCGGDKLLDITTREECNDYSDCCYRDGECIQLSTSEDDNDRYEEDPDHEEEEDKFENEYQRHFRDDTPTTCNTHRFPYNCRTESYTSNNLKCAVNIPYCMRVPCFDAIAQHEVENSQIACLSHPGCCFDEELSIHRRHFGQRILPGVPVCHYAIRNHVFQKHAKRYSDTFGGWNPMLTPCLIESEKENIFGDSPGCYMVTVIEYFGLRARQAGWKNISPLDCHLIDGCFRPGKGCVYPFDPSVGITLKGNDPYATPTASNGYGYGRPLSTNPYSNPLPPPTSNIPYQRYQCQTFRNLKDPHSFLSTYHQCLSSGCSLDVSAHNLYLHHLWNVSQTLSPRGRDPYWKSVMSYEIRADNFLDELQKYKEAYDEPDYDSPIFPLNINHNSHSPFPSPTHLQYQAPPLHLFRHFAQQANNDRCPYERPKVPNFAPLKGSFSGCCEKPLCYFSAQQVQLGQVYSELTYYFSAWSAWSRCTASCGGGKYRRVRRCVSHNEVISGADCEGQEEVKPCNVAPCPHWTDWGAFGACSVTCGGGVKIRRRHCVGKVCYGKSSESLRCSETICEKATPWGSWSTCSTTCGKGQQTRTRDCLELCPDSFKSSEERDCLSYCGKIVWTPWSTCNETICSMQSTASCVHGNSTGYCRGGTPRPKTTACTKKPCYCKKFPSRCHRPIAYRPPPRPIVQRPIIQYPNVAQARGFIPQPVAQPRFGTFYG
ncbi:uncharacterized protein LOC120332621 [Styela clava]